MLEPLNPTEVLEAPQGHTCIVKRKGRYVCPLLPTTFF